MSSGAENERLTLIRMSQYLYSPLANELQVELNEKLIKLVLYINHPTKIRFKTIMSQLNSKFGVYLPRELILSKLLGLRNENKIEYVGRKYYLTDLEYKNINAQDKKNHDLLKHIDKKIIHCLKKHKELETKKIEVKNIIYEFIFNLLKQDIESIKNNILMKPNDLYNFVGSRDILDEAIKNNNITDRSTINKLYLFIEDFLEHDEIISKFLATLSITFLSIELLNLDPEFHEFQKKSLEKKNLIIDTNVLFCILLCEEKHHNSINNLIDRIRYFNINLIYTERTKNEFIKSLNGANSYYTQISALKEQLLPDINNTFIKSYLKEKKINTSLDWHGYYLSLRQVENLLEEKGIIKFDDTPYKESINNDPNKELIIEFVKDASTRRRFFRKSTTVAEHDAYHILLIKLLRSETEPDALGPQYWFLTIDTTLTYVDEAIGREFDLIDYPTAMLTKIYLEFLLPFIGSEFENSELLTFSEIIQSEISLVSYGIDPDLLLETAGPWLNYDSLENEEILRILSDDIVLRYWMRVKMAVNDEKAKAKEDLEEQVELKVSQKLDSKVSSLSTRIANIENLYDKTTKAVLLLFGLAFSLISAYTYFVYQDKLATGLFAIVGISLCVLSAKWKRIKFSLFKGELEVEQ